jgi:hypothetical protein
LCRKGHHFIALIVRGRVTFSLLSCADGPTKERYPRIEFCELRLSEFSSASGLLLFVRRTFWLALRGKCDVFHLLIRDSKKLAFVGAFYVEDVPEALPVN